MKKNKANVTAEGIINAFTKNKHGSGIVGYFEGVIQDFSSGSSTSVTDRISFLKEADLRRLLKNLNGVHGILQEFIEPQSKKNTTITVSWTPSLFICEEKVNLYLLTDEIDVNVKGVTFQGPDYFVRSCLFESGGYRRRMTFMCEGIDKHIREITDNSRSVLRMTIQFKIDGNLKLWLMWVSSFALQQPRLAIGSTSASSSSTAAENSSTQAAQITTPSSSSRMSADQTNEKDEKAVRERKVPAMPMNKAKPRARIPEKLPQASTARTGYVFEGRMRQEFIGEQSLFGGGRAKSTEPSRGISRENSGKKKDMRTREYPGGSIERETIKVKAKKRSDISSEKKRPATTGAVTKAQFERGRKSEITPDENEEDYSMSHSQKRQRPATHAADMSHLHKSPSSDWSLKRSLLASPVRLCSSLHLKASQERQLLYLMTERARSQRSLKTPDNQSSLSQMRTLEMSNEGMTGRNTEIYETIEINEENVLNEEHSKDGYEQKVNEREFKLAETEAKTTERLGSEEPVVFERNFYMRPKEEDEMRMDEPESATRNEGEREREGIERTTSADETTENGQEANRYTSHSMERRRLNVVFASTSPETESGSCDDIPQQYVQYKQRRRKALARRSKSGARGRQRSRPRKRVVNEEALLAHLSELSKPKSVVIGTTKGRMMEKAEREKEKEKERNAKFENDEQDEEIEGENAEQKDIKPHDHQDAWALSEDEEYEAQRTSQQAKQGHSANPKSSSKGADNAAPAVVLTEAERKRREARNRMAANFLCCRKDPYETAFAAESQAQKRMREAERKRRAEKEKEKKKEMERQKKEREKFIEQINKEKEQQKVLEERQKTKEKEKGVPKKSNQKGSNEEKSEEIEREEEEKPRERQFQSGCSNEREVQSKKKSELDSNEISPTKFRSVSCSGSRLDTPTRTRNFSAPKREAQVETKKASASAASDDTQMEPNNHSSEKPLHNSEQSATSQTAHHTQSTSKSSSAVKSHSSSQSISPKKAAKPESKTLLTSRTPKSSKSTSNKPQSAAASSSLSNNNAKSEAHSSDVLATPSTSTRTPSSEEKPKTHPKRQVKRSPQKSESSPQRGSTISSLSLPQSSPYGNRQTQKQKGKAGQANKPETKEEKVQSKDKDTDGNMPQIIEEEEEDKIINNGTGDKEENNDQISEAQENNSHTDEQTNEEIDHETEKRDANGEKSMTREFDSHSTEEDDYDKDRIQKIEGTNKPDEDILVRDFKSNSDEATISTKDEKDLQEDLDTHSEGKEEKNEIEERDFRKNEEKTDENNNEKDEMKQIGEIDSAIETANAKREDEKIYSDGFEGDDVSLDRNELLNENSKSKEDKEAKEMEEEEIANEMKTEGESEQDNLVDQSMNNSSSVERVGKDHTEVSAEKDDDYEGDFEEDEVNATDASNQNEHILTPSEREQDKSEQQQEELSGHPISMQDLEVSEFSKAVTETMDEGETQYSKDFEVTSRESLSVDGENVDDAADIANGGEQQTSDSLSAQNNSSLEKKDEEAAEDYYSETFESQVEEEHDADEKSKKEEVSDYQNDEYGYDDEEFEAEEEDAEMEKSERDANENANQTSNSMEHQAQTEESAEAIEEVNQENNDVQVESGYGDDFEENYSENEEKDTGKDNTEMQQKDYEDDTFEEADNSADNQNDEYEYDESFEGENEEEVKEDETNEQIEDSGNQAYQTSASESEPAENAEDYYEDDAFEEDAGDVTQQDEHSNGEYSEGNSSSARHRAEDEEALKELEAFYDYQNYQRN
eukprot:MONOS_7890.1-p1 / transcript=MONOS_7890.1 / gene=MONOS_7890 / organism=Monocercomonoides_exilis_PA203 / gene_product=unspecified product / transcript_product=unspecified product / location=Mono_scaffold00282:38331-43628(-) / protein_length=1766 / sequence_SO=supercontig / SO=protein_coding / is_pseudo=false